MTLLCSARGPGLALSNRQLNATVHTLRKASMTQPTAPSGFAVGHGGVRALSHASGFSQQAGDILSPSGGPAREPHQQSTSADATG
jgi:hypothetical protein